MKIILTEFWYVVKITNCGVFPTETPSTHSSLGDGIQVVLDLQLLVSPPLEVLLDLPWDTY